MKFSKNKLQKIIDEEIRAILLERGATPRRGIRKAPYQPDPLLEYIRRERGKIS